MVHAPAAHWTAEDVARLSAQGWRVELWEGQLVQMKSINTWRLRRIAILIFGVLLALGIMMFLGVQVTEEHGGTIELIDGQANTDALALPLMLFIVGAAGLMAALGWKPNRR